MSNYTEQHDPRISGADFENDEGLSDFDWLLKALQAAATVSDQYHQHSAGVQEFWNCHEELKAVLDEIPDYLKLAARRMWADDEPQGVDQGVLPF